MTFDDDIAHHFRRVPGPTGSDELRRATVDRAMAVRTRRRRRRRVLGVASALTVLAGGGAVAGHVDFQGSLLGRRDGATGSLDPRLADLPWVRDESGAHRTIDDAPADTVSLTFPAGTTYPQAATVLLRSVLTTGDLPAASVTAPLPRGRVVMFLRDGGIRLSLVAPFGYDASTGRIQLPSIAIPAAVPPATASRIIAALVTGVDGTIPEAANVTADVGRLDACQVLREGQPGSAPCAAVRP